jgi:hypothetical protein
MSIKRSYGEYLAVASEHGFKAISETQWSGWQERLPEQKPVEMPSTLNHAIAVTIEAGDQDGAAFLIKQCNEHDQDCWMMYTTEGEYFPAGGLWMNQLDWMNKTHLEASPLTVAHMLDFDGQLPDDITKFELDGVKYYFNAENVAVFKGEMGWSYLSNHHLVTPSIEAVSSLVKSGCSTAVSAQIRQH